MFHWESASHPHLCIAQGVTSVVSGDFREGDAEERLAEEVEVLRGERPTADGVEQLQPGATDWDLATAEQRLSAAQAAPAAADVSLGPARGGLHADGVSCLLYTSPSPRD